MNVTDTYGNIACIQSQRCEFDERVLVKVRTKLRTVQGTVVGAIHRPYWHPHCYSAYHIVTDDGRRVTLHWKEVRFV